MIVPPDTVAQQIAISGKPAGPIDQPIAAWDRTEVKILHNGEKSGQTCEPGSRAKRSNPGKAVPGFRRFAPSSGLRRERPPHRVLPAGPFARTRRRIHARREAPLKLP